MKVTIEIKQRTTTGQWDHLAASEYVGKTLEQFFASSNGKEIVAEINIDGRRMFFCGTDHWCQRMATKGQAIQFDKAIAHLQQHNPDLLTEVMPEIDTISNVFEGATVVSHEVETS